MKTFLRGNRKKRDRSPNEAPSEKSEELGEKGRRELLKEVFWSGGE